MINDLKMSNVMMMNENKSMVKKTVVNLFNLDGTKEKAILFEYEDEDDDYEEHDEVNKVVEEVKNVEGEVKNIDGKVEEVRIKRTVVNLFNLDGTKENAILFEYEDDDDDYEEDC